MGDSTKCYYSRWFSSSRRLQTARRGQESLSMEPQFLQGSAEWLGSVSWLFKFGSHHTCSPPCDNLWVPPRFGPKSHPPRSGTSIDPPRSKILASHQKKPATEGGQRIFFKNIPLRYIKTHFFYIFSSIKTKIRPPSAAGRNFLPPPSKIFGAPLWVSQGTTLTHTPPGWAPNPTPPGSKFWDPPRSAETPWACMVQGNLNIDRFIH